MKEGLITDGISEEEKKRTTQLIYHYREGKEVSYILMVMVEHVYSNLGITLLQFHSLREPLGIAPRRQRFSSQSLPKWLDV